MTIEETKQTENSQVSQVTLENVNIHAEKTDNAEDTPISNKSGSKYDHGSFKFKPSTADVNVEALYIEKGEKDLVKKEGGKEEDRNANMISNAVLFNRTATNERMKPVVLTEDDYKRLNYRNVDLLKRFISQKGKILSRRLTSLSYQDQKTVMRCIKRARNLALLPFEAKYIS